MCLLRGRPARRGGASGAGLAGPRGLQREPVTEGHLTLIQKLLITSKDIGYSSYPGCLRADGPGLLEALDPLTALRLQGIDLQGGDGVRLPALPSLQHLQLAGVGLQGASEDLWAHTALTHLNLSDNDFQGGLALPLLGGLVELLLSTCGLPEGWGARLSITKLDIPNNRALGGAERGWDFALDYGGPQEEEEEEEVQLPAGLSGLRELGLSTCSLQVVPRGFEALTALTSLHMVEGRFWGMALPALPALERLFLHGSSFTHPFIAGLMALQQLSYLDLNNVVSICRDLEAEDMKWLASSFDGAYISIPFGRVTVEEGIEALRKRLGLGGLLASDGLIFVKSRGHRGGPLGSPLVFTSG